MDNEWQAILAMEDAERAAEDAESTALISITTLPEIKENLRSLRDRWERKAKDAASLVCTDESVQSIKQMRADMRKEYEAADEQRKAVKAQYLAAWNEVEATWKECVAEPFKRADASYKDTIGSFEDELKAAATEKLKSNYEEHCQLEGIDWLPFDEAMRRSGVKIGMADTKTKTPRKAMDALAEFVSKVALGIDSIRKMEDSAEILVEFKKCLDAGQAAAIVAERKREVLEAAEAEERRKVDAARQQEMVERVEAIAPTPVPAPAPDHVPVATPAADPANVWKSLHFTIFFKNPEEFQKVRPALSELKKILIQEGISYGK